MKIQTNDSGIPEISADSMQLNLSDNVCMGNYFFESAKDTT